MPGALHVLCISRERSKLLKSILYTQWVFKDTLDNRTYTDCGNDVVRRVTYVNNKVK